MCYEHQLTNNTSHSKNKRIIRHKVICIQVCKLVSVQIFIFGVMTPGNLLYWSQHFKEISCSFFRVKVKRVRMQSSYICTPQRRWSLVQSPLPACSGCQQSCYLVCSYPVCDKNDVVLNNSCFLHISYSLFLLAWTWFYFICLPMHLPVTFH
jgi:hypothetical protein